MLVEHARRVRRLWRVVPWRFLVARWRQAFPWSLHRVGVQRGQQALAGQLVQGQAVGALGEMVLHFLIALSEFFTRVAVLLKWVTTSF